MLCCLWHLQFPVLSLSSTAWASPPARSLTVFSFRLPHVLISFFLSSPPQVGKTCSITTSCTLHGAPLPSPHSSPLPISFFLSSPPQVGKTFSIITSRVRPAPCPPRRVLVPLTPSKPSVARGKFTLLTYNLLADLYATARVGVVGGGYMMMITVQVHGASRIQDRGVGGGRPRWGGEGGAVGLVSYI